MSPGLAAGSTTRRFASAVVVVMVGLSHRIPCERNGRGGEWRGRRDADPRRLMPYVTCPASLADDVEMAEVLGVAPALLVHRKRRVGGFDREVQEELVLEDPALLDDVQVAVLAVAED